MMNLGSVKTGKLKVMGCDSDKNKNNNKTS